MATTEFSTAVFDQRLTNLESMVQEIKELLSQRIEYDERLTEKRFLVAVKTDSRPFNRAGAAA